MFDKDEISDAEYEKLLREDMDEEEFEEMKAKEKGGDKEGEEEEESLDDNNDDEIENNVFAEYREKQQLIQEQEKKLLNDKPWQMQGEIRAHERPKDALVDNDVEFQHGVELKAKSSAKVSKDIESVIQQRILKEAFDDPKQIVIKQDLSWKKNFEELDFEKDTRGLAALYEEEYKKNMLGLPVESKEQKVHREILSLFREVSNCLDNLTNSSFVPMPLIDERREKKKDIETINLEEKIPITVKTSDSLQPKKLYQPRDHKAYLAEQEKTQEDRRRDRMIAKRKIRTTLREKKRKDLVKELEVKGQTKYEHNLVNHSRKAIEHEHANAKETRHNLTKSSDLFKVLQANSDQRRSKPRGERHSEPIAVQQSNLKKLKL